MRYGTQEALTASGCTGNSSARSSSQPREAGYSRHTTANDQRSRQDHEPGVRRRSEQGDAHSVSEGDLRNDAWITCGIWSERYPPVEQVDDPEQEQPQIARRYNSGLRHWPLPSGGCSGKLQRRTDPVNAPDPGRKYTADHAEFERQSRLRSAERANRRSRRSCCRAQHRPQGARTGHCAGLQPQGSSREGPGDPGGLRGPEFSKRRGQRKQATQMPRKCEKNRPETLTERKHGPVASWSPRSRSWRR